MRQTRTWQLLLTLALMVLGGGVAFTPRAMAAEGYNISVDPPRTQNPALGVSADGRKVCAVWTTFDVNPQAYARVYDVGSQSWSPALNSAPFQLSEGGFSRVNFAHCAFDGQGNLHAVWEQGAAQLDVAYRFLPAGADAANGGNWSGVSILERNADAPDIAALNTRGDGPVWLVNRRPNGSNFDIQVRAWSPSSRAWGGAESFGAGGTPSKPLIGVDNANYVHVVYQLGGAAGAQYAYRNPDGGFVGPIQLPNGDRSGTVGLAVNRDRGDVHVVFGKNFTTVFYTKKTGSTGTGFSAARPIYVGTSALTPRIAWAAPDRLVMVTDDEKRRIAAVSSDDGGANWSDANVVASPGGGAEAPWVALDPGGTPYIAYAHRGDSSIYFTTGPGGAPPPAPPPPPPATPPATTAAPIADGRHDYFAQTGHNLGNAFREYWLTQGGLLRFGYPLTEEFVERSPDDGRDYTVQYFERARFEWHPENAPPYNVLLGRLGLRLHPLDPPVSPLPDQVHFPQTGHNLGGAFLFYWQHNGGLAVFGYPTTEEFTEVSPTDGKPYTVQYFERNRFEYHPENEGTPYNVLLGLLGRQQLVDRGWLK
jgi:hypothetical protein